MRYGISYPLHAIRDAAATVIGWTAVIAVTTFLAFWIGVSIAVRDVVNPVEIGLAISCLPIVWVVEPQLLVLYFVTFVSWYMPIHFDSLRLRIGAVAVNSLFWLTYPTIRDLFGWGLRLF
jgi:hypothetical protein